MYHDGQEVRIHFLIMSTFYLQVNQVRKLSGNYNLFWGTNPVSHPKKVIISGTFSYLKIKSAQFRRKLFPMVWHKMLKSLVF